MSVSQATQVGADDALTKFDSQELVNAMLRGANKHQLENNGKKDNKKTSITDTDGNNTIQIPSNTYIDKAIFTKNAAQLTLENGREITINAANQFVYNLSGNVSSGETGVDLSYTDFASIFGVDNILSSTGVQDATIVDMYII